MKAALLTDGPGELVIADVEISSPKGKEVLLRTVHAGLCHSDLHVMKGDLPYPMPVLMGHESAGVVEEVGPDVTSCAPGDHVITYLALYCGRCRFCLDGRPTICENVRTLERARDDEPRLSRDGTVVTPFARLGSFAERMLVHEHAVVKIREDMPLDKAALIGCGVSTGLGAAFNRPGVRPGDTVAVIGAGGVGLSVIQGARIAGANRIIVVDVVQSKLDLALQLGGTDAVNAGDGDPVAAVQELSKGGVDIAFEAIGLTATAEQAFKMIGRGGTAVMVGVVPAGAEVSVSGLDVTLQEKTLMGSYMGSVNFPTDLPRFVDMYLDGRLRLDEMVSHHLSLEQVNEGFELMAEGKAARSVIDF
ncbi:MAG: Zn-dependent alcohol dehydrogenase [Actinomycetota bacterium]